MFTDTIVFRGERNVKITSFLSAKTLSKAYCVTVYGRLNIPVSTSELISIRSTELEISMKFVL